LPTKQQNIQKIQKVVPEALRKACIARKLPLKTST